MVSSCSSARPDVHLLQDGLVICRGPNILAHLAAVYLGGPILARDLGLLGSL